MSHTLFLTQVLPYPLNSGAKIRQYHVLHHLTRRHEVTLVPFTRADNPLEAIEYLRGICHEVHPVPMRRSPWRNVRAAARGMLRGLPMVLDRHEIREMTAIVMHKTQAFACEHAAMCRVHRGL